MQCWLQSLHFYWPIVLDLPFPCSPEEQAASVGLLVGIDLKKQAPHDFIDKRTKFGRQARAHDCKCIIMSDG